MLLLSNLNERFMLSALCMIQDGVMFLGAVFREHDNGPSGVSLKDGGFLD
jgi:hypothetical protein